IVRAAWRTGKLRRDIGLGDIGLMVIRLARPLPGTFTREFDDAAAHRQLDIMLDGLRGEHAASTAPGLSLDDVRDRHTSGTRFVRLRTSIPEVRYTSGGKASVYVARGGARGVSCATCTWWASRCWSAPGSPSTSPARCGSTW